MNEDQIRFVSPACFSLVKQVFPSYKEIRRVLYQADKQVKVELHLPVLTVLLMENKSILSNELRLSTLQKFSFQMQISRFLSAKDLSKLLREMAFTKLQRRAGNINCEQILLPSEQEVNDSNMVKIIRGKAEVSIIKEGNLSQMNILNNGILVFYFKDEGEEFTL